jgi:hypothetical protein
MTIKTSKLFIALTCLILGLGCSKKDDDEGGGDAADPASIVSGENPDGSDGGSGAGGSNVPGSGDPVVIVNTAPEAGAGGALSISDVNADSAKLGWTLASDAETAASDLKYIVYISSSNNLGSIDEAETNGNAVSNYRKNADSFTLTSLSESTTYFVNVLVKDGEGKQTVYKSKSLTTKSYPIPGGGGVISAVQNGTDVDVSWTPGIAGLQYRLYYSQTNSLQNAMDTLEFGIPVGAWSTDIGAATITNPGPSKRLHYNVLMRDSFGSTVSYTANSFETDAAVFVAYEHLPTTDRDLMYIKKPYGQGWSAPMVVDNSPRTIYQYPPSLRVDANNVAHIAYYSTLGADLWYAKENGGAFDLETVATISTVGPYPALDFKADGTPVIVSYATDQGPDLYYFEPFGGSWAMQSAFSAPNNQGYWNALVVDDNNVSHACTYETVNDDVYYVTNASGTWVSELVDSADSVGEYCDIALDSNGKAHISYYNSTPNYLTYATNATGSWVVTTIDTSGNNGLFTSIDLDENDHVHIAYAMAWDLRYVTNKSGSWVVEDVDVPGTIGNVGISMKLDALGRPHIAYYDGTNSDLKYTYKSSDLAAWDISTIVVDPGITGYYPSLDVR